MPNKTDQEYNQILRDKNLVDTLEVMYFLKAYLEICQARKKHIDTNLLYDTYDCDHLVSVFRVDFVETEPDSHYLCVIDFTEELYDFVIQCGIPGLQELISVTLVNEEFVRKNLPTVMHAISEGKTATHLLPSRTHKL